MKISTVIILILLIGAFFIVLTNNIDLSEKEDQKTFIGKFFSWLVKLGKNTVNLVGHVISDYDWKPESNPDSNITNITKQNSQPKIFVLNN